MTMNLDTILQLKLAVPVMLVLNVIGFAVKKSPLPTWLNVWLLPILGGVVYPLLSHAERPQLATDVIYGIIIGGFAVGGHQLFTQTKDAFTGPKDKDQNKP